MKNQTLYLNHATDTLKENNQSLRLRQIKPTSRFSIDSRDSMQNLQTIVIHYHGCKFVTIEHNKRNKLFFKMKDGFNSHHLNRNKTDDSIDNLVVVREKDHNFCDFHGNKYISGLISYEEYINTIKPFIVWGVD